MQPKEAQIKAEPIIKVYSTEAIEIDNVKLRTMPSKGDCMSMDSVLYFGRIIDKIVHAEIT